MKLNNEQKEILVDSMFERKDTSWLEMSLARLKTEEIEIFPNIPLDGWWSMYIENEKITDLNFNSHPEVLEKICLQK